MSFPYSAHDPEFKARLIRNPGHIEGLQYDLKHHKDEILACKGCLLQQEQIPLHTTETFAAVLEHDCLRARWPPTTSSMASALLPELLLEIFHLLVFEDPPLIRETWDASETKILATPHLGWIRVSHVCRRWRNLAVGTAALWTNFGHGLILGSLWIREFIARAKGANASIPPFEDYPQSINMVCSYIMDHSPHIRDLSLSADWTSTDFLCSISHLYLPMMVSVDLDAGLENWHSSINLFGGYAPNLRHLRLCNIVPWTSHTFFANLIELDLFLGDNQVNTVEGEVEPVALFLFPPLAQVLDILDEASRLERLSLHYVIPPEDFTADESRKVHFPHLKSFSMASLIRDCVSFLKRVVFPHDVALELNCIPGLSPEKFQDLFRTLAYRFHSARELCLPIERLELGARRFNDRALIRVYSGHADTRQETDDRLSRRRLPQPHATPRPMITLSLAYASPQDHDSAFRAFFSLMPLHDLIYLSVYGCSYIHSKGWRSIIRDNYASLQSVRFLVLGHDCAQYFFHAIHDEDDFLSGFGPTAFPNLDRLIFRRVDFSAFPQGDVSGASFQDQMLYHLRERIRRGKPLRAVFFFSCQGIDEEWFRSLEELVKFVRLGL